MPGVQRLKAISENMEKWRSKSSLAAREVTLIAVSKTHPAEALIPLIEAGHRVFCENRVQEAAEKWPALRERYPDIELHLIGSLQTNKVKDALALFDVIHTVDRPSLVDAIAKERSRHAGRCGHFLVQVNTGEEPQKGGVKPEELEELMRYTDTHASCFTVSGLMCVPPAGVPPAPHFALLHTIAHGMNLPYLSMGMSGDYETAIRFGATHIRVGTAIFGERDL